jgi:hypothetical protein
VINIDLENAVTLSHRSISARSDVRRRALRALAAMAMVSALALTGCSGGLPWDQPSASAGASGTTVPAPVPNDLSSGSTARTLSAGAVGVSINYWSTLNMADWTSGALKPVSISLITSVTPNDGQKVYLQRATMVAVPGTLDTTFDPLAPQNDQSTVAPGYLVLDPYSYSQTFNVGPVPAEATLVTLQFTYDFLVQTTPTSTEYAKQSASDTLTVAIVPQPTE